MSYSLSITLQFCHKNLKAEKNLAIALQRHYKIISYDKIVVKLQTELPSKNTV